MQRDKTKLTITGSMARSMWGCLLWRWKFGLHSKWLAYCVAASVSEGILSWAGFDEVYKISSCDS